MLQSWQEGRLRNVGGKIVDQLSLLQLQLCSATVYVKFYSLSPPRRIVSKITVVVDKVISTHQSDQMSEKSQVSLEEYPLRVFSKGGR